MIKTNFHTHTQFCDGKNTAEEIVLCALSKNFSDLGFSIHSFLKEDTDIVASPQCIEDYRIEIARLKSKYDGKIDILCGIEQDYFSEKSLGFDYIIGSVHNVRKNGKLLPIDVSKEFTKQIVDEFYGGDFDALAEDYFLLVADVVSRTNADIIGHFDLVSKYSEQLNFGQSERYINAAKTAIQKLVPFNKPFEINTGAMSRGVKSEPYPSSEILEMIFECGGKILFSSDCHDADFLDFGFDMAEKLAYNIGFREQAIIKGNKIEYIPIDIK